MLLENPDFGDIDIWVPAPGENEVIACFESQAGLCKPAGSFVAGVEKTVAAEKATADGTLQPALSPPGGDVELAYGLQGVGSDKGRLARWVKGFHQFYCTESPAYVSPPNGGDESAPGPLQETGPVQQSGQGAGAMAAPAEGAAGCNETGNTDGHTPSIKVQVLVLLPGKHVTDAVAHFDLTCVQVFARFSHGAHGEGQGEGGPKDALEAAEGAAPTLSADIVAHIEGPGINDARARQATWGTPALQELASLPPEAAGEFLRTLVRGVKYAARGVCVDFKKWFAAWNAWKRAVIPDPRYPPGTLNRKGLPRKTTKGAQAKTLPKRSIGSAWNLMRRMATYSMGPYAMVLYSLQIGLDLSLRFPPVYAEGLAGQIERKLAALPEGEEWDPLFLGLFLGLACGNPRTVAAASILARLPGIGLYELVKMGPDNQLSVTRALSIGAVDLVQQLVMAGADIGFSDRLAQSRHTDNLVTFSAPILTRYINPVCNGVEPHQQDVLNGWLGTVWSWKNLHTRRSFPSLVAAVLLPNSLQALRAMLTRLDRSRMQTPWWHTDIARALMAAVHAGKLSIVQELLGWITGKQNDAAMGQPLGADVAVPDLDTAASVAASAVAAASAAVPVVGVLSVWREADDHLLRLAVGPYPLLAEGRSAEQGAAAISAGVSEGIQACAPDQHCGIDNEAFWAQRLAILRLLLSHGARCSLADSLHQKEDPPQPIHTALLAAAKAGVPLDLLLAMLRSVSVAASADARYVYANVKDNDGTGRTALEHAMARSGGGLTEQQQELIDAYRKEAVVPSTPVLAAGAAGAIPLATENPDGQSVATVGDAP